MSKAERLAASATTEELAERCLRTLREWSRLQRDTSRLATRKANRLADAQRVYLQTLGGTVVMARVYEMGGRRRIGMVGEASFAD